jgi:murein DD-endopeptidase MepM/ murein hydrolase activator NlpD
MGRAMVAALATGAMLATWTASSYAAPAFAAQTAHRRATARRPAASTDQVKNLFWQPNDLVQGSPAFFTVELLRPARRVSATWTGKTLSFFHTRNPRIWYALAGADLEVQPGSYPMEISAALTNGRVAHSMKKIDVGVGTFGTGEVTVPENYVEPNAQEQRQIASDQKLKDGAFAHDTPQPLWSGNFVPPVSAKPTPSFGESRLLNEEHTSTHRGTDYPVPEGTPVVAANSGTVVLATSLYYEGNCVILDHGQRFFTIYMHLKQIDVHEGDGVEKGKRLGLSGATGRVTGPHVHLGVRWNGANLDPVKLLALTLPEMRETSRPEARRRAARRASRAR